MIPMIVSAAAIDGYVITVRSTSSLCYNMATELVRKCPALQDATLLETSPFETLVVPKFRPMFLISPSMDPNKTFSFDGGRRQIIMSSDIDADQHTMQLIFVQEQNIITVSFEDRESMMSANWAWTFLNRPCPITSAIFVASCTALKDVPMSTMMAFVHV
jgi:hypothetical protein